MRELLALYPGARNTLFQRYHLGGCSSCAFSLEETLAALCARKEGMDAATVLSEIEASQVEENSLMEKIEEAARCPKNQGEMPEADAIGTVGGDKCGDMLRLWIKFREEKNGERVIDKATFQSFGCQTAIAVASVATELLRGKTPAEALSMRGEDLSAPLGPLPPMKIHCAQLVEEALQEALAPKI